MNLPSGRYELVIYVNADADRASGGIVLNEAKKEFEGVQMLLSEDLPIDIIVSAALCRADAVTGDVLETMAPVRMIRYLEDRLHLRLERLRVDF